MHFLWFATVPSFFRLAVATLLSFTIDDQLGDLSTGQQISYQPPNAWGSNSIGGCFACPGPDSQLTFKNTWHGGLFNSKNQAKNVTPLLVTVPFYGTSVSVNCILSDSLNNPPGISDMTFLIDGQQAGRFTRSPTGTGDFQYNVTVFISATLQLGNHTLVIQNGRKSGELAVLILDSIVYFYDDQATAPTTVTATPAATTSTAASAMSSVATSGAFSKSPINLAAIVGGVLGTVAILLLALLAFLCNRHRSRRASNLPFSASPIYAPVRRLRRLWTHGPDVARPAPDMAPVPFTSPAHHPSRRPPPPSAPGPRPAPAPRPAPPAPSSRSRISFNPNLLVGRFQRRPPPPPIATRPAPPVSPAPPSGLPLLPGAPPAEPHDVVLSIQEWQRHTVEATAAAPPVHPLDMSEVDLSSHYDESSTDNPPPAPAPPPPRSPQPPQRRFTVMNN